MLDATTKLYCIFGNPVGHSKSPLIHNALFNHYGLNAAYLAFKINHIPEGLESVKTLNIRGASVTIPFKTDILNFLDEISDDAEKMGAVNTVVNEKGRLYGYNTDCMAAIRPLKPYGIKGKSVTVLGAGGAAQAIVYGINKEGGKIKIINRSRGKGEKLAKKFNCDFISLDELTKTDRLNADIVINTTSVGMHPKEGYTPLPSGLLTPSMIVMDVVYTPVKTRLLQEAEQKGCIIIDGLSMFLHQGAAQFRLWTGIDPDIDIMREAIAKGEKHN